MRIAAVGDGHLGRSYYPSVTDEGVNTRERDFEISFLKAIDKICESQVDLVVWLGDIFDHPRPTYRSFRVAQAGLVKLRQSGLQCILISGNHDTPRLPGTGNPYLVLADRFEADPTRSSGMGFATTYSYECFDLGDVVIHAVPQMLCVEDTLNALEQAKTNRAADKVNLLITHPRVPQVQPRYSDINEIEIDAAKLQFWDFVLLGHYHTFTTVYERMWYAGATDTFSFADDPTAAKGFVILDTDTGVCSHYPLDNQRPLITVNIPALGCSASELTQLIAKQLEPLDEGAVVRCYLDGVQAQDYRLIDSEVVHEASRHLLHLKLDPNFLEVKNQVELPTLDSMQARWSRYLQHQDLSSFDKSQLEELGNKYLIEAVERE